MNKHMYTMLCSLLSLSMVLTACGGSAKQTPSEHREQDKISQNTTNSFRINMKNDPTSLNPGQISDQTSIALIKAVMEGLTRIGPDGKPQNAVAENIKISADQKTYTFKLRETKWSNGDPVTAGDFEYAWKWELSPKNDSQFAYQLYPILNAEKVKKGEVAPDQVGIKAIDTKTLEVTLTNPTPYFLEIIAFPTYFPVNQKIAEKNNDWQKDTSVFVGNGPFKPTKWQHGSKIILEKNTTYWDATTVKLNQIDMTIMEDPNKELSLFKDGNLDWAGAPLSEIAIEGMPELRKSGRLLTFPIAGTYLYKFNTKITPFNNTKIRKAFAYAINRKMLAENIMQDGQMPAMAYVPPTMFKENEKGYFPDANYEEAKKLLKEGMEELGISELPPIELSINTSEAHTKIAGAIQDMWKSHLGAEVALKSTEWNDHLDNIKKGKFQIARISWLGDFNDPATFLEIYTLPQGNNNTYWTNDQYNQLIKASYSEKDATERQRSLREAEKILMDEMPFIPIYFYTMSYAKSDKIKDIYIDSLGNIDFKWAHLD
ncbi:MAG TPA: peptide ABC transporter substrate-binding protein [Bacillota bacterium]|nr:peptide ABC transporter substrate-binding protein [Bacillota bacterium]